jgi:UDP-N-acetylmuramoyl-L-alanyl-D-glutamate--2,6-diaminopimelate ligase
MEKMMQFGKSITKENGRLIAVFGSAGKRDVAKRAEFGKIADEYCDYVILTEDDPRDEDPKEIADQIKTGLKKTANIFIQDRYEAIRQAVESADEGDTILLLGKGDEPYIYRENGRAPYIGDHVAVRECIHARYGTKKEENQQN